MKQFYQFDPNSLKYNPVKIGYFRKIKHIVIMASLCFSVGYFLGNRGGIQHLQLKFDKSPDLVIGSAEWKDSVFTDYEERAAIYLSGFPNTPIEAGMLRLAAYNVYDSTGVLLPVELALAQAQMESSMGTKGRSPKNNPFNVGEYDSGTTMWMSSTYEGIEAYYFLMCKNYLRCKDLSTLFKHFSNCNGHRYASNLNYENVIKDQFYHIKNVIDKKLTSDIPTNKKPRKSKIKRR